VINKGQLLVVDSVDNILQRGVQGYVVFFTISDGLVEEQYVEKDDLQSFIHEMVNKRQSIVRVEPCRKNMEEFFLELVVQ
jgi:ABC-2 type transport system ATP-binding protein